MQRRMSGYSVDFHLLFNSHVAKLHQPLIPFPLLLPKKLTTAGSSPPPARTIPALARSSPPLSTTNPSCTKDQFSSGWPMTFADFLAEDHQRAVWAPQGNEAIPRVQDRAPNLHLQEQHSLPHFQALCTQMCTGGHSWTGERERMSPGARVPGLGWWYL